MDSSNDLVGIDEPESLLSRKRGAQFLNFFAQRPAAVMARDLRPSVPTWREESRYVCGPIRALLEPLRTFELAQGPVECA